MGEIVTLSCAEEIESARHSAVRAALPLMKEALAILDAGSAGFAAVACNLSLAIDLAEGRAAPTIEEALGCMMPETLASTLDATSSA